MDNIATGPATEGASKVAEQGLLARFVGILMSPRATFAGVVARPRWFGMLALTIVISIVCISGFMSTAVGRQAMVDQVEKGFDSSQRLMRGLGIEMPESAREQALAQYRDAPTWRLIIGPTISILIITPIVMLIIAGIFFGVFAMMGGGASFKQVLAVVVHAGAVSAVGAVFLTPLNYFRESLDSAANLYVFVSSFVPDGSVVAKFLGMIDLFRVWWVFVLATGLAVLYRRRTQPIAISLYSVYGIIALVWAVVAAWLAARSGA
jgi:hypothetical protein